MKSYVPFEITLYNSENHVMPIEETKRQKNAARVISNGISKLSYDLVC